MDGDAALTASGPRRPSHPPAPARTGGSAFSMRWWLALVFAGIVVLTAVAVAQVMTLRSEKAFRGRAEVLAAGTALTSANEILERSRSLGTRRAAASVARSRRIAIFLFDASGRLLTPPTSNGVALRSIGAPGALAGALARRRIVQSVQGGRRIVVALPVREPPAAAMVTVVARPDLVAAGDIVRGQLLGTVALAIAGGGFVGIVVAFLITWRLRRIARAAAEIARGNFEQPLAARFPDELGKLATAMDSMRRRLRDSFAAVQGERDRMLGLLEQLQEGVIAVDRELRVVFANSRAKLLLGRRALDEGRELPDPWPQTSLRAIAARLFAPAATQVNAHVSIAHDRRYAIAGVPSEHPGDTVLLVIRDVTLTDRRERAEREFVANAAHELRTPLAAIGSAIDVLQAGAKEDPEQRDRFLDIVERQSTRLGRLVHALLTLARAQTRSEPVRLEPVDVGVLVDEAAAELRETRGVQAESCCPRGLVALAHPELLGEAIGNLARNAAKHAAGGRIELAAERDGGDRIRIEVRDEGAGIHPLHRERVFDRFYRSDDRGCDGFGLGLSIVREVTEAMGGEVEIDARDGGGTVAAIVVPAARVERRELGAMAAATRIGS